MVVIAIAIAFLAFARDPLIDSVPTSALPLLFKSQGLTALGYGAAGSCAVLAVLVVFAAPYWLMSKILGLPVRDDNALR